MSIKSLEQMGAFVSAEPVLKTIKFKLDGKEEHEAQVWVRALGLGEYEKLYTSRDDVHGTSARVIAAAISFGEKGEERIPVDKAYLMHKGLANALIKAFHEVNGGKN